MSSLEELARISAGTLLNAQEDSESGLSDAVTRVAGEAATEAESQRKGAFRRKATLLAVTVAFSRKMAVAATAAIVAGRQSAREQGADRIVAELAAAGVVLGASAFSGSRSLVLNAHRQRLDEDELHAHSAGESLASQWRSLVVTGVSKATRNETDPIAAIRGASSRMAPRIKRTSATETAQAYSDEHLEALKDALRHDSDLVAQLADRGMMRRWVAMIDACPKCWPLDGVTIPIEDSYPGGEEPGHVHVHCACVEIYVSASEAV